MYAVIFRATTKEQDQTYSQYVQNMRQLAFDKYNCIEFFALTEGDQEVAISYWHNLEDIKKWKENAEHASAQALGRTKWYKSYKVEIVEIKRSYER